jgi:hypothetical protein
VVVRHIIVDYVILFGWHCHYGWYDPYISTWQLLYLTFMYGMIMRHMALGIIHGWVYHYGRVWSLYLKLYISFYHICHIWYIWKLFPISFCWGCFLPNVCIQTQIIYMHTFRGASLSLETICYMISIAKFQYYHQTPKRGRLKEYLDLLMCFNVW